MYPYQFKSITTSSIDTGYFVSNESLEIIRSGSLTDVAFGKQDEDVVEIAIYDASENLINFKRNANTPTKTVFERSYLDTTGNLIDYSFSLAESSFYTVKDSNETRSIVVSPVDDVKSLGLSAGNYKISYTVLNDVIGSSTEKLEIASISPSRAEITVIPSAKISDDKLINKQFNKVLNDSIFTRETIDDIISRIRSKRIDEIYEASIKDNERLITEIKLLYALPRDIDMINFLTEILSGRNESSKTFFYQFENWLFSQYDEENSFLNINNFYNEIAEELIKFHLVKKSTVISNEFTEYVAYIKSLFDQIFTESIFESEDLYFRRNGIYLKHFLNFENGNLLPILNYIGTGRNVGSAERYQPLAIKLKDPLPDQYDIGSRFIFSRLTCNPVFNDFIIYKNQQIEIVKIKGPNFKASSNENLFSTKQYSIDSIAPTGSIERLLEDEDKNSTSINIDYSKFENFVKYSSAVSRVRNYERKINEINRIDDLLESVESKLEDQPSDPYYLSEKVIREREIKDVKNGFDAYEKFLFDNPDWYVQHSSPIGETARDGTYETSASLYDEFNNDSLESNTPDFITEDSENYEYVDFLNMVGQMFDDIWSHIEYSPAVSQVENRSDIGISDEMIKTMLKSLGWEPESGTDHEDLLVALTGEGIDGEALEAIPAKRRTQTIWKRILNNLPYILKTKGTEEAIRSLFTCYGIPRALYSIREFGGIKKIDRTQDDNQFIFDNDYYALHFQGDNEFIQCSWSSDIQTVEFKFAFDKDRIYEEGEIYRLAVCDDRWLIGAQRERGSSWGRVFFTLSDTTGSGAQIKTLVTDHMPIFNGDLFSVMLRRNDVENYFGFTEAQLSDPSFVDQLPVRYDLVVKRAIDDRIVFEYQEDFYFTGSYNSTFRGSSGEQDFVYFGNYMQQTGSLIPDPEAYFGVIDQIRFWKTPLSDKRFDSHVFFIGGYDTDFPDDTQDNLKLHLNFNSPQNLYSGSSAAVSGAVIIENNSLSNEKLGDIYAYSFPDLSTSASIEDTCPEECCDQLPEVFQYVSASFPWHFQKFQTRELVRIPDYGSAKFRSNNVNYITQDLEKPLFYDSRTTKPSSKVKTKGSNGLGVFFSPTDDLNTRIIEFFGDFDISDFIGDPSEIYNDQYKKFKIFKLNFYKTGLSNIDFQSYINLIKSYFDNSLFKHLKTIVPAKSTFRTGILIEPSILERDKVKTRPLEREIHNNLETSRDVIRSTTSELNFGRSLNGNPYEVSAQFRTGSTTQYPRNFYTFVDNQPDNHAFEIYSDNGVVYQNGKKYYAEIIKEARTLYAFDDTVSNDNYVPLTQSFEKINLIPLGDLDLTASLSSTNSRILRGYDRRHFKFKRNFFGKTTEQTEDTTINPDNGILNNSEVVVLTTVDRAAINVGTEGEGVVLDTDS